MLRTTEKLIEQGFQNQIIKDWSLLYIFTGTDASRYALMNKALKKKEIIRLHRGMYMLAPKYREKNISQFFVASQMVPDSFISCETALSYHGWIPEKVTLIKSVIPKGRTRSFHTPIGEFEYIKIPEHKDAFLNGVTRKVLDGQPFLIATPLRALADYVYTREIADDALDYLQEGMRIEQENLDSLTSKDFDEVIAAHTAKRVLLFLHNLRKQLGK